MATEKIHTKVDKDSSVLVASTIYLLMNKSYYIPRNVRAQWFLKHLNSTISVRPCQNQVDTDSELVVVSVLPQDPPKSWSVDTRHEFIYLVTTTCNIVFFSEIYSTVYCLDISPSISAVDIQHGEVMLDEIVDVFSESLKGVIRPFNIPGSTIMFEPQIFVTVIVHTPFFTTPAQQVLVQGWQVTPDNLEEFLAAIRKQLQLLEDTIADVSALAYDQLEAVRIQQIESERLVGGLFEESPEKQIGLSTAEIPMVSPDSGFINLLRYGMLALQLLPQSSLSNLIVVTDGVISLPDIHVLELVLTQLRTNSVAVSFLHVGSQFHPHCSEGLVPYSELLQFIACATFGTYIPLSTTRNCISEGLFNTYHEAFLTWNFKKGSNVQELCTPVPRVGEWFIRVKAAITGDKHNVSGALSLVIYELAAPSAPYDHVPQNVTIKDGQIEMNLMLPWANHIYIEYLLTSEWPVQTSGAVQFYISIKAPYEFLHDITCLKGKQFKSPYRQAVVSRFWNTLKTLSQSDLILAHLDSFPCCSYSYTIPESVRSGMPLFYLPSNTSPPALSSSDISSPQFALFWRPICLLDPSVWHKWMHTHSVSIIFQHDMPLPKFLYIPSPNGRLQSLLCRQAAATLYNFLKDSTSFVLLENHSFIKFIFTSESNKIPTWFYIVRVQQKPPCAVVHIAFLLGTPGKLRHQIVDDLKKKISVVTTSQRASKKESTGRNIVEEIHSAARSNVLCCTLLNKPLEKILIRYERMPSEFETVVFPDGTQPQTASKPVRPFSSLVTSLSRYLHHRRWIWSASFQNQNLGMVRVSKILGFLTQMRLEEGFRFAHSTAGIINMVLEVQMKCCDQEADHICENCRPCIIQYVLFPLNIASSHQHARGSSSEDENEEELDESERESTIELITECWIEPQHGVVANGVPQRAYMDRLPYHQLADSMWRMDAECISTILTFEQLRLMSLNPLTPLPPRMDPLESQPRNPLENWPHATALSDQRIQKIPFAYNIVSVLPDSQQIELEFPMFIQDLSEDWHTKNLCDAPNVLLMDSLVKQIKTLHDKEIRLNPIESKQFLDSVFKRKRNFQQHPVPFPERQRSGSSSKNSSKILSEKEIKEADKENECPRKGSLCASTPEKQNLSIPSPLALTTDKSKQSGGVRKSCGPLYRMYTKTPLQLPSRRDNSVEPDTPKWRFFVKKMSESYVILTFLPASYQDCKALMLGAEPKSCAYLPDSESMVNIIEEYSPCSERMEIEEHRKHVGESKLNSQAKPFHPYMLNRDMLALLNCPSPVSSRGWILDSVDSASNVFDSIPSISDLQNQSAWEVNQENLDPISPFRLRARSWEPMKPQSVLKAKKHISPRMRTCSVGSKGKNWNESKLKKRLLYGGSSSLMSLNNTSSKEVLGSINVPIYVYGCCIDNLVDSLVLKAAYTKDLKDLYWRKPMKSDREGGFEQDEMMEDIETLCLPDTTDDTTLIQEYELQQHAKTITQMFSKSFGVSLFKSLHVGHQISSFNVQSAMEECEEALVQISITDYMQIVCRHLKEVKDKHIEDEEDQETMCPFSIFENPLPCQEYRQLHKLIKNKFHHIITASFKPVPTNPDYFFCSPLWVKEPKVDPNKKTINTTLEEKQTGEDSQNLDPIKSKTQAIEVPSEPASAVGTAPAWEGLGSVATPDEARTSLLSNMDSDSVSIIRKEEINEDISPLFLQLICTVRCKEQFANCVVRILPTCLGEVISSLDFLQSSLDLNTMSVSLDILCLTLPHPEKPSPSLYPDTINPSPNTNSSNEEQQLKVRSTPYTGLQVTSLPDYQHKAVVTCADEIQWLLRDEIAAFLLDSNPVTQTTLQFIADHVTSSVGRSSCILQTTPLHFVFGAEKSLQIFMQDISEMRVPGYCLKMEEDYYYLVKDSSPTDAHRDSLALSQDLWVNISLPGEDIKPTPGSPTNNESEMRLEVDPKYVGCSSIAAWHAEVAHLMESGTLLEGFDGKEEVMDQHTDWLNDLELKRLELPNFWLIMTINEESVISYFHCRFLELETSEVKLYSLVQKKVVNSIKALCKTVNQKMLLNNLHDTRICNQLIEPESTEEKWKGTFTTSQPQVGSPEKEPVTPECVPCAEASLKYVPGWFSCPVVWETNFTLHPRLKTGATKPGLSRGIQALRTVLNRFSVSNRNNMFVYQDNFANVFYLRLYENTKTVTKSLEEESSPLSVSRSSSVTSLNLASIKKIDEASSSITSAVSRDLRPRLKSFGEISDNIRLEEFLTLKVHGISEAGTEIKNDLVQVLQNRLDDAVLEVLSVMLARNPMCKLSPEDTHFIQKPNHFPNSTVQFSLPKDALDNSQAVFYYLHQNLLQFLHIPKYTDSKSQHHFQDYSHPEEIVKQVPESNIYLFNQSATSGNKGLACVAVALVDCKGNIINQLSYKKPSMTAFQDQRFVAAQFNSLTATNICQPEDSDSVRVEFRMWKQGRVNIESLTLKLKAAVRHALWDITLELKLLTAPLSSFDPPSMEEEDEYKGPLNPVYQTMIAPWMQFGHKLGVPAVSTHVVTLSLRHSVNVTLKELSNLVSGEGTTCYVYYQKNMDYLPYNWSNLPSSTSCLLIARNMDQWRASLVHDSNHHIDKLEPKAQKLLQKFSPFLVTVAGEIVQFVPRQRFLIAIVNNEKVILHTYNWVKDLVDSLVKKVALLGQWLSARSYMQICIAYQKMGLFTKQPMCRKDEIQMKNPYLTSASDVENLITFNGSPGNVRSPRSSGLSALQLQDALKGVRPVTRRMKSSDPVATSIKQLLDTKAQDKRVHQKKLYTMWQSRATSPNISIPEEVMELFFHNSRVIHYCVTPLLFLPRWRVQSASTRDFSLKAHKNMSQSQDANSQEEKWHQNLCASFINEYNQYLQSLGFIPIQCVLSPKRGLRNTRSAVKDAKTACYLQKSLLGGLLVFELYMCEPFFNAKLYALEGSRLEEKPTGGAPSQLFLSFLDECEKMKVLMHLHSFTYDYHLRTLANFTANQDLVLRPGYHITNFLDDFLKYYSKAPNYAYCLVHSGNLVIPKIPTTALQLFNYMLKHQDNYPMKVLRMSASSQDLDDKPLTSTSEYVLIKHNSSSQLMYCDIQDSKQIYEYDIVLIVAKEESPDQSVLRLSYYILLSSKREPYAKLESEKKLGKFRTVSTASHLNLYSMSRETTPPIPEETPEELAEGYQNWQKTKHERQTSSHHVEIKPESVNYLGYYSSHEQFMQQLILEQANVSKKVIEDMITLLSSHCRTHLLWTKLNVAPSSGKLTYAEFHELLSLATSEAVGDKDARISPLLAQPLMWYMSLSKLITMRYPDHYRSFVSPDGCLQYTVILHPKWIDGFVMITMDFTTSRAELSVVVNKRAEDEKMSSVYLPNLIEDVINCCCFHLWTGLL